MASEPGLLAGCPLLSMAVDHELSITQVLVTSSLEFGRIRRVSDESPEDEVAIANDSGNW
jgi:hypothetical protein